MSGKVLKVVSNDLYGNVDDRIVRVYACFCHTKYMNNYVVFSIEGDTKKLYYGSIHLKEKSVVIFAVDDKIKKYISSFIDEYMNDKLKNFNILDIDNIEKVELVSYSEMEYDKLKEIDDKAIPKVKVTEEVVVKEKKPILLYIMILILVLLGVGITILYLKPELFTIKYKGLECTSKEYDEVMELYYDIEKNIVFDTDGKLESIDVVKTYTFLDVDSYDEFKNIEDKSKYFNNGENYKYIDEELKFRLFYQEESVIDDYDEMFTYLKREGFSCVERVYEK